MRHRAPGDPDATGHPSTEAEPPEPWDVLVTRRTGDAWSPVGLRLEAVAALALAFPGTQIADARFAGPDEPGHLLLDVLPRQVVTRLLTGSEYLVDLPAGYRVTVPAGSLGEAP